MFVWDLASTGEWAMVKVGREMWAEKMNIIDIFGLTVIANAIQASKSNRPTLILYYLTYIMTSKISGQRKND